jgi:glycosyltransferase involved in cell wall biosynthesis
MEYTNHKLSILTLTLNEEEIIRRTLDYIVTLSPYDIIIVDGGSKDKTLDIIEEYANKYENITWKLIQNKMEDDFSKQRNLGLAKCEGDWVLVVDADETHSESLKWHLQWFMDESKVLAWAMPRIHLYPDEKQFLHKSYPDTQIRLFKNLKEVHYDGKVHEMLFYNEMPLTKINNVRFTKYATIIHWALLKSENALIDKGTRWEQWADESKHRGFDIGTNNPRRFIFKDRDNTKDEVPRDLIENHPYIFM